MKFIREIIAKTPEMTETGAQEPAPVPPLVAARQAERASTLPRPASAPQAAAPSARKDPFAEHDDEDARDIAEAAARMQEANRFRPWEGVAASQAARPSGPRLTRPSVPAPQEPMAEEKVVAPIQATPKTAEPQRPPTAQILDHARQQPPKAIWDLEDEINDAIKHSAPIARQRGLQDVAPAQPELTEAATPASRTKTRLLGFEHRDGAVKDLFDRKTQIPTAGRSTNPVGWIVVTDGPGRGACFTLFSGMSAIGRGPNQTIQLDFGDTAISRDTHAAVVYDPETHSFYLGHGGKANIVRLNDRPVVSTEPLKTGDQIRIGETRLRFLALCSPEFNWIDTPASAAEESGDVAIA